MPNYLKCEKCNRKTFLRKVFNGHCLSCDYTETYKFKDSSFIGFDLEADQDKDCYNILMNA